MNFRHRLKFITPIDKMPAKPRLLAGTAMRYRISCFLKLHCKSFLCFKYEDRVSVSMTKISSLFGNVYLRAKMVGMTVFLTRCQVR